MPALSSLIFTATLADSNALITSLAARRLRAKIVCTIGTRVCKLYTVTRTSTLCRTPLIAPSKINSCRRRCARKRVSSGSWSRKRLLKAKVSRSSTVLRKYREVLASLRALCNSTSQSHYLSTGISGIFVFMSPSLPSIRWGSTSMKRAWPALRVRSTIPLIWRTFSHIWRTIASIRGTRRQLEVLAAKKLFRNRQHQAIPISTMLRSPRVMLANVIQQRKALWKSRPRQVALLIHSSALAAKQTLGLSSRVDRT